MAKSRYRPVKAYRNTEFLGSRDARALRIQAEYLEPETRFEKFDVDDTIVFFGSARFKSRHAARRELRAARADGQGVEAAEKALEMSRYYEDARVLARRLTEWSKGLDAMGRRFVVCTGGGPGIMEAANRGASEAKGLNIGLNISLPAEQHDNPYITHHLGFEFHYFFMRKFWFIYLAKAVVVFPGGLGTLDELMEVLTLEQTGKLSKPLSIVLFGTDYWRRVVDFDALIEAGTIDVNDLASIFHTDSVDAAYNHITADLTRNALASPGGAL
jgi:hypothetical protein